MSSDSDDGYYYYRFEYKTGVCSFKVSVDCADADLWLDFAAGERDSFRMDIYPTDGGAPTSFEVSTCAATRRLPEQARVQYGGIVDIQVPAGGLRAAIAEQLVRANRVHYS